MNAAAGSHGLGTRTRRSRRLAFLTIAGLAASGNGLYAQTAPPDTSATADTSGGLQEITVTRHTPLREHSVGAHCISAFTADSLQQRNLSNVNALGNLTPSVNLDQGAPFSGDRSVLSRFYPWCRPGRFRL